MTAWLAVCGLSVIGLICVLIDGIRRGDVIDDGEAALYAFFAVAFSMVIVLSGFAALMEVVS